MILYAIILHILGAFVLYIYHSMFYTLKFYMRFYPVQIFGDSKTMVMRLTAKQNHRLFSQKKTVFAQKTNNILSLSQRTGEYKYHSFETALNTRK